MSDAPWPLTAGLVDPDIREITLHERRPGVHVARVIGGDLLRFPQCVLAVMADRPEELLRRLFPQQATLGAVERIRELVTAALPGIGIRPMRGAPRCIPFHAGAAYFELDCASPEWMLMRDACGFAVHVSQDFPNLKLTLWAIRG
ncbi:type VI secretion system baseplate subunit TssK [Muricoccus radiodurans]|uniref:type VI secretion system baseplate subunit TssK n=1 Tax=Muricoccus radiodurans TaxID=2231721 RepID=UPI003CE93F03